MTPKPKRKSIDSFLDGSKKPSKASKKHLKEWNIDPAIKDLSGNTIKGISVSKKF